MSDVINKNKYLDLGGLKKYDDLIKAFIASGNTALADAIAALNAKIGELDITGSDDKTISDAILDIYASIADIIASQDALKTDLEGADAELAARIQKVADDLEFVTGSNSDNEATLGEINAVLKSVQEELETIKGSVDDAVRDASDALVVAGEAKTAAEGAVSAAEQASAAAGESAASAESAQVAADAAAADALAAAASAAAAEGVAGEAKTAAEGAVATAGEAATTAGEAKGIAEQAQSDASTAKADAATAVSDASTAKADAATAVSDASTAKADAATAVETANSASSTAGTAQTTANEAAATAGTAATTAGEAKDAAESAVSVANEAKGIADDAAAVAGEANTAASTNATAIGKLDERIADLEGISNVAEVKYEGGYIKLYDKDGNAIGEGFSAADFVVDGMLESVGFKEVNGVKTNDLVFTFNTDHGLDVVEIDFSKYVDVYHADETSLTLDSDSKTFSVKEVAANKTKLGQKITIAGGPLANNIAESGEVWPSKWTNGKEKFIPEDATMYDIVMNLFCVEKWPTSITTGDASLISKMDTPSLTYNGKNTNNSSTTVEVGTTVSYEANSGKSSYTATPYKASGFTYGYSAANDNTVDDASSTSKSASFGTISAVESSVPTLTLSGKVSDTVNGTAGSSDAGAATKSGSVVIALGDNKIKAQSKSITYTGTCSALPVYYGCSNLGNTEKELSTGKKQTYPSTAKDETTLTSTAVNSGTIEINCVGAYQVFVGYVAEVPTASAGVRAMNANNRLGKGRCGGLDDKGDGLVYTINNNYMVVAVPTGWDFTIQNDLGQADQRNSFTKSDSTVAVELPNHTAEVPSTVYYDIWSIGWSGGAYKNLIIK